MTNREALEIAHAYGLTVRQHGADIRACLAQARAGHPYKTIVRAFADYIADTAHEIDCASAQANDLFGQEG